MRLERAGCDEYYIIESPRDLWGWEIVEAEPWKDGVKRLHARRSIDGGMEFRMMYCAESILADYDVAGRIRTGPALTAADLKQSR